MTDEPKPATDWNDLSPAQQCAKIYTLAADFVAEYPGAEIEAVNYFNALLALVKKTTPKDVIGEQEATDD